MENKLIKERLVDWTNEFIDNKKLNIEFSIKIKPTKHEDDTGFWIYSKSSNTEYLPKKGVFLVDRYDFMNNYSMEYLNTTLREVVFDNLISLKGS